MKLIISRDISRCGGGCYAYFYVSKLHQIGAIRDILYIGRYAVQIDLLPFTSNVTQTHADSNAKLTD